MTSYPQLSPQIRGLKLKMRPEWESPRRSRTVGLQKLILEVQTGFEPVITVLQTVALTAWLLDRVIAWTLPRFYSGDLLARP